MSKIIKLDRHVADLIAAGEVIERPASVVKELVENAVDSGADAITVEIRRGGMDLIRVSDNGSGIEPEDIRTAFLRHATSKIRTAADIDAVMTMGFRGEALASVAAVSKVSMYTRTHDSNVGYNYEIWGGDEKNLTEAGCPPGTTIVASELFYNTPARMKFIKKDVTEAGHVQTVVRRAALARPDISFKLIRDGEELLHTPGDNSLLSAMYCIYGNRYVQGMEKVSTSYEGIRVWGYVSKPTYSQGNRSKQEFFVNDRPIRSGTMTAALESAYKNRMMTGRFPTCVLHIEIPPVLLDVNVHPAKSEVKFAYERPVYDAIFIAVKDAVDSEDPRAAIVSKSPDVLKIDIPEREYPQTSINTLAPKKNPDFYSAMSAERYRDLYAPRASDDLQDSMSSTVDSKEEKPPQFTDKPIPVWKILGESFGTYIIVEDGDDILFIDKHAAHERIIFNKLLETSDNPISQYLLESRVIEFDRDDYESIIANMELVCSMGFEVEEFGGNSLIVRAVPEEIDGDDVEASLQEIALSLRENRRMSITKKRDEALRLVACKAALKAGNKSSYSENRELVTRVMEMEDVRYCPHGRPVAAVLSRSELEKRFGRT